jgi:hypothetical protein
MRQLKSGAHIKNYAVLHSTFASAASSVRLVQAMLVLTAFLVAPLQAQADEMYTFVGFTCDSNADRLVVYYRRSTDDNEQAVLKNQSATEWRTDRLILSKDETHIASLKTARGKCVLKRGTFEVNMGPTVGNWDAMGPGGAEMSAWVEIRLRHKALLPHYELESASDSGIDVTTKIVIAGKTLKPAFTKVPYEEFYKE